MKSLGTILGPCSWASCPQLCVDSDLPWKPPSGPLGAAAGGPAGLQETGLVLGRSPGHPGPTDHVRQQSLCSLAAEQTEIPTSAGGCGGQIIGEIPSSLPTT